MANYAEALEVVIGKPNLAKFSHEGSFVDDPDDPGGITDRGISLRFLVDHGIDIDNDGDVDADDIRHLKYDDLERLYRQFFWNLVHGDNFGSQEMASKLFDMAVNMGPPRAIRIAQVAAEVDVDGSFGPKTFRALNVADPKVLLAAICAGQSDLYKGIAAARPKSQKFLPGWLVRSGCTLSTPCKTCLARLRQG